MKYPNIAVSLLLFGLGASSAYAAVVSPGQTYTSTATYYGTYVNGGGCVLDPTPPIGRAQGQGGLIDVSGYGSFSSGTRYVPVAIAANLWNNSAACGAVLEVTASGAGSGGSPEFKPPQKFLAYVNNVCPDCQANGLDIGIIGDGIWNISYKVISPAIVASPSGSPIPSKYLNYKFQGANEYFLKVQVANQRNILAGLEIFNNNNWVPLSRTSDNFYGASPTIAYPLTFPASLRATDVYGNKVYCSVDGIHNDTYTVCGSGFVSSELTSDIAAVQAQIANLENLLKGPNLVQSVLQTLMGQLQSVQKLLQQKQWFLQGINPQFPDMPE